MRGCICVSVCGYMCRNATTGGWNQESCGCSASRCNGCPLGGALRSLLLVCDASFCIVCRVGVFFSGGLSFFFCIVFLVRSKVLEPFANIGQVFWSCDEYECMQTCCSPDFRLSGWQAIYRLLTSKTKRRYVRLITASYAVVDY